ncbi:hypothetical protein PG999_001797 [Apiospora kogelbergensis]|uniref:Uncharacterized protein n=1 Tax=Apiospora kogelbergensis TaxID=1337665 RepID=A0AAW0R6B7_9PEZI
MYRTIAVLSLLFSHASSICYYPDGSVSAQDTPCDDASAEATCCGQGYACLSNHICKATGDEIQRPGASLYVRGSCTDKLWRSSSCPNFCVDGAPPNSDFVSGGMGMDKCPSGAGAVAAAEDMYYCINSNTANVNCDKKQNIVSFRGRNATGADNYRRGSLLFIRVLNRLFLIALLLNIHHPRDAYSIAFSVKPGRIVRNNNTGNSTSNTPAQFRPKQSGHLDWCHHRRLGRRRVGCGPLVCSHGHHVVP